MESDIINPYSVAADSSRLRERAGLADERSVAFKTHTHTKKNKSILATGSFPIYFLLSWF